MKIRKTVLGAGLALSLAAPGAALAGSVAGAPARTERAPVRSGAEVGLITLDETPRPGSATSTASKKTIRPSGVSDPRVGKSPDPKPKPPGTKGGPGGKKLDVTARPDAGAPRVPARTGTAGRRVSGPSDPGDVDPLARRGRWSDGGVEEEETTPAVPEPRAARR